MELLAPVDRVGNEEVAHLATAEVKDVRAPVGLFATLGVGVLKQWRAVEACQGELILGEVRGNPVNDDADAGLVQCVNEVPQLVRCAES